MNEIGETVEINEALGLPVILELKHGDFLLHADETRFDLNSREDCKVGGENVIGGVAFCAPMLFLVVVVI